MIGRGMIRRAVRGLSRTLREEGPATAATRAISAVVTIGDGPRLARHTFRLGDRDLRYFDHPYNRTIRNERAVEVAVAMAFLDELGPLRLGPGLEVGNVLRHYGVVGHEVIDKYEPGERVTNIDVTDAHPAVAPQWVITLSTLEHVGWDEVPRTPGKAVAALHHLHSLLAPGGRMLVTTPLGWNPDLDQAIVDGLGAAREWFLERATWRNEWKEVERPDAARCRYDHARRSARCLWISEWRA